MAYETRGPEPWGWMDALQLKPVRAMAARISEPVSTRLTVGGLSVSLLTWRRLEQNNDGNRERGEGVQRQPSGQLRQADVQWQPNSGSSAAPNAPKDPGLEAWSRPPYRQSSAAVSDAMPGWQAAAPTSTHLSDGSASPGTTGWGMQQREAHGDASRRRKRVRPSMPFTPQFASQPPPARPPRGALPPPPRSSTPPSWSPSRSAPAAPAAKYVILQQWGLEVTLTVMPPGDRPNFADEAKASIGRRSDVGRPERLTASGSAAQHSAAQRDTAGPASFERSATASTIQRDGSRDSRAAGKPDLTRQPESGGGNVGRSATEPGNADESPASSISWSIPATSADIGSSEAPIERGFRSTGQRLGTDQPVGKGSESTDQQSRSDGLLHSDGREGNADNSPSQTAQDTQASTSRPGEPSLPTGAACPNLPAEPHACFDNDAW